jgi:hypothetical protein
MTRWTADNATAEERAALAAQIRAERDRSCIEGIARLADMGLFEPRPAKPRPVTATRKPRRPRP